MINKFKVMFAALVLAASCSVYAYNTEIVEESTRKINGTTYIIDDLVNFTSSNKTNLTPEDKAEFLRAKNNVPLAVKRIRHFNGQDIVKNEYYDKDGKLIGAAVLIAEPVQDAKVILP